MLPGEFQGKFRPDGSISFMGGPDSTVIDVLALVQIQSVDPVVSLCSVRLI